MMRLKLCCLALTMAGGLLAGCKTPIYQGTSYQEARRVLDSHPGGSGQGVRQVSFESEIGKKTAEKTLAEAIDPAVNFGKATQGVKEITGYGIDEDRAKKIYAQADSVFQEAGRLEGSARREKFVEAAGLYATAAARWPESGLEQDALFMIGESYFFADNYVDAEFAYGKLIKKYPSTKHLDRAIGHRFLMAQYWLKRSKEDGDNFFTVNMTDESKPWRDTWGHGLHILDRIRLDDPTSPLADDATLLAANTFMSEGKYLRADHFYTDLRQSFPSSEHQFDAHFLGLKAKLETYQGPQYSGKPLDEAEKLVDQLRKQFPRQTAERREIIDRADAEIRMKQAERLWNDGSYFDYRTEYASARHYYEQIVKKYAGTPHADRAQKRLAEIAGRPDKPVSRFDWFVRIFESETDDLPEPDYSNWAEN